MLISEHAVASDVVPTKPVHCPIAKAYLFASRETFDLIDQIPGTPSLGIIFYGLESDKTGGVFNRLKDIISLIELANPSGTSFRWLDRTWLEHGKFAEKFFNVEFVEQRVMEASQSVSERDSGLQLTLSFDNFRCPDVTRQGLAVNIPRAIDAFSQLEPRSSLRALVSMASFAFTAPALLNRIYDNDLLPSSLLWSILDKVLPSHSCERKTFCPKCGEKLAERRHVSTDDRINRFVGGLALGKVDKELMIQYLKKLYAEVRNPFYHKAAHETSSEAMNKLMSALHGQNEFAFADDVQLGRGSAGFQYILQHLIRHLLFDRLNAVVDVGSGLMWPT